MNRIDILQEAIELTSGDRNRKAGDFVTNHTNIAKIWSVILGIEVQPHQVALCMAGMKLARCVASLDLDHFVDGAAYFAGAGECAQPDEPTVTSCIIVPSRGRPENITDLIHALHETQTDSDLVVVVDNDDAKLPEYQAIDGCQLIVISSGPRGVVWPLNRGAQALLEWPYRHFIFMGDDHRPRTKNWDAIWRENLDELGTGIVYGDDLFQSKGLPTQVGMTRNIVEALNGFVPAVFQHLYCDDFWLALGNDLGAIRYLPETVIEHLHPVAEKAEWDDLYREVNLPENYDLGKAQLKDYLASEDYRKLLNNLTITSST